MNNLLTVKEASEIFKVSRSWLYDLVKLKAIPYYQFPKGKGKGKNISKILFDPEEVKSFLKHHIPGDDKVKSDR